MGDHVTEATGYPSVLTRLCEETRAVLEPLGPGVDDIVRTVTAARRIACYGVGREGLVMKAFCMRMMHLGLDVAYVGDMTTPPLGAGDVLIVSAGPGEFSTVAALMETAKAAGASTMVFTAQPAGGAAQRADVVVAVPTQTMADAEGTGVLPMGSQYELALWIFLDIAVLELQTALQASAEAMRHRHTNLE
jgi:6-phospho-3-hexuloisomerase